MCIFKQTDLYHHQYHKFINILKLKTAIHSCTLSSSSLRCKSRWVFYVDL